jgi:hypothetical protein
VRAPVLDPTGRGRLDSLVTKGLAAYLIATRLSVPIVDLVSSRVTDPHAAVTNLAEEAVLAQSFQARRAGLGAAGDRIGPVRRDRA